MTTAVEIHSGKPLPAAGEEAIRFTKSTFVFDCLSLFYILEDRWAERCLEAGVNAANVTFGAETDWDNMVRQMDVGLAMIERSPYLALATDSAGIEAANRQGRLAVIMGTQGSMMVDADFHRLGVMHRMGLRFFGLAYTGATLFADGCGELRDGGLSFLGRDLVDAVNELPLILDLSHCGHRARLEGAQRAKSPCCTHSNAYSVVANDRNTRDDAARAIMEKGGIMGVCGLPRTVQPDDPTILEMLDHCDYWATSLGVEHTGLGFDFTEGYKASRQQAPESVRWRTLRPDIFGSVADFMTQDYPAGMRTILDLPNFTQGLFDRGYSQQETAAILGGNWRNFFERAVG